MPRLVSGLVSGLIRGLVPGLVAGLLLAACTADDASAPRRADGDLHLDASVAQYRFNEGTRDLRAGITNQGRDAVRVSQATVAWDGLAFPTVPIPDGTLAPGETAAFTIQYGAPPQCSHPPATRPRLVAVVDGRSRTLPLRVEDPELLDRLHEKACTDQRVSAAATVRLVLRRSTVTVDGEEYVPGRIELRRRPGTTDAVQIVDLSGSVLLDLVPRSGAGALPASLRPDQSTLNLPVLIGSAHRCDAHARSQSSQTFLLGVHLRLDREQPHRRLLIPAPAEQVRLLALIDRACT
jgi:hypothetical protein